MGADVPLLCCRPPPCTAVRISDVHFWPIFLRFVRALRVYPYVQTGRCSYVAVLVDGTLPIAVLICKLAWVLPSLMLEEVEAHVLLFAGTQILPLVAAGTPQQYICLHRSTRRSRPATFHHTPSFRCLPYRQQATTCLPVKKRGRLTSSTRPNLDAHESSRSPSRPRDSRRGEPPEKGSGDETEDGPPDPHPDPSAKRVDSPVRVAKETNKLHRTRGRLHASSRQTRGSDTSGPPRARQGTITAAT